jgi:hypothetical protein
MKIINGGKKDYYDYLAGVYGIDEDIVYDRRDGEVIKRKETRINGMASFYFSETVLYGDKEKEPRRVFVYDGKNAKLVTRPAGEVYSFILEVGYLQLVFSVERFIEEGKTQLDVTLKKREKVQDKIINAPLAIIPCEYKGWYMNPEQVVNVRKEQAIVNPVLAETWIPAYVCATEMYNEIYNYLISIREPKVEDSRNDVQKLESKGFDKTTSFRNPVNKKKKKQ